MKLIILVLAIFCNFEQINAQSKISQQIEGEWTEVKNKNGTWINQSVGYAHELKIKDGTLFFANAVEPWTNGFEKYTVIEAHEGYIEIWATESDTIKFVIKPFKNDPNLANVTVYNKSGGEYYKSNMFFKKQTREKKLLISKSGLDKKDTVILKDIAGVWKVACTNKSMALLISDNSNGDFDIYINDELARVSINFEKISNNEFYLKYSVLTGLTRRNRFANWINISRDSIIARFEIINENTANFKWYGFYNSKSKRRELFNIGLKNAGCLLKCKGE